MSRILLVVGLLWSSLLSAQAPVLLVMGDSLGAAYGIAQSQGWVALMQARLTREGYPHRVVNASISGETTAGGLARLPAALDTHRPKIVLIELGGNDGLRGQPLKAMRGNLSEMARLSRAAGAQPVLFEMRIPANYGPAYSEQFFASFGEVARALKLPLVPFLLADFATDESAFQPDGIHPTAAVQPRMLEAVWPVLRPLLK